MVGFFFIVFAVVLMLSASYIWLHRAGAWVFPGYHGVYSGLWVGVVLSMHVRVVAGKSGSVVGVVIVFHSKTSIVNIVTNIFSRI